MYVKVYITFHVITSGKEYATIISKEFFPVKKRVSVVFPCLEGYNRGKKKRRQ
jgi:hypothetical protein